MGFPVRPEALIQNIQSGVETGVDGVNYSSDTFEDGILVGRFVKLDSGSIDNLDASATPVIAGVSIRNPNNPIEAGGGISSADFDSIDYRRVGHITVDAVAGQVPTMFDDVFAVNLDTAERGKARLDATNAVATTAEFIRIVNDNVWLVRLK